MNQESETDGPVSGYSHSDQSCWLKDMPAPDSLSHQGCSSPFCRRNEVVCKTKTFAGHWIMDRTGFDCGTYAGCRTTNLVQNVQNVQNQESVWLHGATRLMSNLADIQLYFLRTHFSSVAQDFPRLHQGDEILSNSDFVKQTFRFQF